MTVHCVAAPDVFADGRRSIARLLLVSPRYDRRDSVWDMEMRRVCPGLPRSSGAAEQRSSALELEWGHSGASSGLHAHRLLRRTGSWSWRWALLGSAAGERKRPVQSVRTKIGCVSGRSVRLEKKNRPSESRPKTSLRPNCRRGVQWRRRRLHRRYHNLISRYLPPRM